MTPLLANALADLVTRALSDRPPLRAPSAAIADRFADFHAPAHNALLQTYEQVGWVHAATTRIAQAVAAVQLRMVRDSAGGEEQEVETHPVLDLLARVNPFHTYAEFMELSTLYLDITGESWWLLPMVDREPELWVANPAHMRPVLDEAGYPQGYIHQIGQTRTPLELEDVIFTRYPHPRKPWRGLGPVQAIMTDVEAERFASSWNRTFFRNSARPGGVVQTAERMNDADFATFMQRWREQHQGESNAHRVAILEGAEYKDVGFSQRDMEFPELRRMNRDAIFGALGVHPHILGIAEDVNRANAEAAEEHFARWTVVPRVRRFVAKMNEQLLPRLGAEDGMRITFDDPVPENVEQNSKIAVDAFKAQILTRDEARSLVGFDAADVGGEDFAPSAQPQSFGVPLPMVQRSPACRQRGESQDECIARKVPEIRRERPDVSQDQAVAIAASMCERACSERAVDLEVRAEGDPAEIVDLPPAVQSQARAIADAWDRRFERELRALAAFLRERLPQGRAKDAGQHVVDEYDWDWWARFGEAVVGELAATQLVAMAQLGAQGTRFQQLANDLAERRGAQLLRVDGDMNLTQMTRRRVAGLVSSGLREGQGPHTITRRLRDDFAFSRARASTIARTETATAQGQAAVTVGKEQGRDEKRWRTARDERVDGGNASGPCIANEAAGWIDIRSGFPSGHDSVPAHPNCRCDVETRTAALSEEDAETAGMRRGGRPVDPDTAAVVRLVEEEGLSYGQAAQRTGLTPDAVRKRVRRARERDTA